MRCQTLTLVVNLHRRFGNSQVNSFLFRILIRAGVHERDWESTDDNESRANIYVHKSQKTGKDKGRKPLSFWLSLAFSAFVKELV